jgi:hypothetical protein
MDLVPIKPPDVAQYGEDGSQILATFQSMFQEAEKWRLQALTIKVTDVSQTREMKLARESRLALKEVRGKVESNRKALKESIIRRGKAIDGIANVFKDFVVPIEEYLENQEKFAEREEEKRLKDIADMRYSELQAMGFDSTGFDLCIMDDSKYQAVVRMAQQQKVDREAQAEKQRIEEEEARRQHATMEEERRKQVAKANAEAAEARKKEAEARRVAAEAQAEANRLKKAEADRIAAAKRAEQDRIRADQEAKERAAKASDGEKLVAWSMAINTVASKRPACSHKANQDLVSSISKQLQQLSSLLLNE